MIFFRLKDIAMAFQQMSQEENNQSFVPLALYIGLSFYILYIYYMIAKL